MCLRQCSIFAIVRGVSASSQPVLILGAGINGCAIARELLLNGVPVCLVDTGDIASGTTAYSSRLIHGGLRYLEYGEFDLVRESLAERTRLLELAPQFVRPLRLFIPVRNRFGGLLTSAKRFLKLDSPSDAAVSRGVWLARIGLVMYDTFASTPNWPRHRVHRVGDDGTPPVDFTRYQWLCSYWDAQIAFPERYVVALVEDARRLAAEQNIEFQLLTYHRATLNGKTATVAPVIREVSQTLGASGTQTLQPAAIFNATGAWVDLTLQQLHVPAQRLMGGTKGSHFFTTHEKLRDALGGKAIYGEADDGRPVFILPLCEGTLIGTTDVPFEGDPAAALATDDELNYLIGVVNEVLPHVRLTRGDIDWHYSGVRPLPYVGETTPASITRRHWLEEHRDCAAPLYSVIGGKLTTNRSLAESAAETILSRLGKPVRANSRDRIIPGGENYPRDEAAVAGAQAQLAQRFHLRREQIATVWSLCGTRTESILPNLSGLLAGNLTDTQLPRAFVRWVIRHESPRTLDDLVERRLMLLYQPRMTAATLRDLSKMLVEAGLISPGEIDTEVRRVIDRLQSRFGKIIAP